MSSTVLGQKRSIPIHLHLIRRVANMPETFSAEPQVNKSLSFGDLLHKAE